MGRLRVLVPLLGKSYLPLTLPSPRGVVNVNDADVSIFGVHQHSSIGQLLSNLRSVQGIHAL